MLKWFCFQYYPSLTVFRCQNCLKSGLVVLDTQVLNIIIYYIMTHKYYILYALNIASSCLTHFWSISDQLLVEGLAYRLYFKVLQTLEFPSAFLPWLPWGGPLTVTSRNSKRPDWKRDTFRFKLSSYSSTLYLPIRHLNNWKMIQTVTLT